MTESGLATLARIRLLARVNLRGAAVDVALGFVVPTVVLWLLAPSVADGGEARLVAGSVVLGAMNLTLRKAGIDVAAEGAFGVQELLATTALGRRGYLVASLVEALALAWIPLAIVPAASLWLDIATLPPAGALAAYFLLVIALWGAGVLVADRARSLPVAALYCNLIVMICLAFCPVVYAQERVPAALAPFVRPLPPSLASAELAASLDGAAPTLAATALLAAWALALATLAAWTFRLARVRA
jgi:ABC-type polysaccharide/polyol phosphate export permease